MAQDTTNDSIHQKVAAVKEVVTGRTKHEITLVLQHFENDVPSTIQAFIENGARDILQEWQSMSGPGNKPANKKKKKNKNRDKPPATQGGSTADTDSGTLPRPPQEALPQRAASDRQRGKHITDVGGSGDIGTVDKPSDTKSSTNHAQNKVETTATTSRPIRTQTYHNSSLVPSPPTVASQTFHSAGSESVLHDSVAKENSSNSRQTVNTSTRINPSLASNPKHSGIGGPDGGGAKNSESNMAPQNRGPAKGKGRPQALNMVKAGRDRTISESSTASVGTDKSKKPHAGLEKSSKDLTRQTMSLNRQKMLLDEHVSQARKQISMTYAEIIEQLKDREVSQLFHLNKVKNEAHAALEKRQDQGSGLKARLERAPSMNDTELRELRADIKHFVSERKIDEDLGNTKRFNCDLEHLKQEIDKFGEVVGVKATYSTRRASVTSITSSIVSHDDLLSPLSPPTPFSPPASSGPTHTENVAPPAEPAKAPPPVITGAKVISQSESVTRYETSEMAQRRTKDTRTVVRGPRPSQSPRRRQGQGHQGQGSVEDAKSHRGQGDVGSKAEITGEDTNVQQKSRSARRRQKLRERNREQKAQEGKGETDSSTRGPGQQDRREAPKSPQNKPQREGDSRDKSGPRQRNRRTPSPKKRMQASEGQKEDGKEGQRSQGQGSQSPRQRRPRSNSNRSRTQAAEGKTPKVSDALSGVSETAEANRAVTVSMSVDTPAPESGESQTKVSSLPQETTEQDQPSVQVNGDSSEKSVLPEKDINENNSSKSLELPVVNGDGSEGDKVTKTATVSIVPPKMEVTKATISINSEEALPQRKVRSPRRREVKGVTSEGETSTNGICGVSEDEEEPGYPIVNGEVNGTVNGEINGHDTP